MGRWHWRLSRVVLCLTVGLLWSGCGRSAPRPEPPAAPAAALRPPADHQEAILGELTKIRLTLFQLLQQSTYQLHQSTYPGRPSGPLGP
jgi:hypothetical protein